MHEFEAGIIRTESRGGNIYIVHLSCGDAAREAVPGQFVQVRVGTGTEPFLRRTFSIYGVDRGRGYIQLMVEVVGTGTGQITAARHGDCLNIIGPLGKGFDLEGSHEESCVLVAGGVGIAPLIFLADALGDGGARSIVFMAGARTVAVHRAFADLIPRDVQILEATDDGSLGYHGFVTGLLEEHFASHKPDVVYTCGPDPMMKTVSAITARAGVRCQASLEERMACGMGVCYGCAVSLRDGRMVRSCVEGPVFNAHEVDW